MENGGASLFAKGGDGRSASSRAREDDPGPRRRCRGRHYLVQDSTDLFCATKICGQPHAIDFTLVYSLRRKCVQKISLFLTTIMMAAATGALAQNPAPPFTQCPHTGLDASCRILIVIGANGGQRILTDNNASSTYDGSDDTLIGVLNLSNKPISSIPLVSNIRFSDSTAMESVPLRLFRTRRAVLSAVPCMKVRGSASRM